VKPVERAALGEDYKVWQTEVRHKPALKGANAPDRVVFHCEMSVRFVKAKPTNANTPRIEDLADEDKEGE
jgi:hypothetical protein